MNGKVSEVITKRSKVGESELKSKLSTEEKEDLLKVHICHF